MDTLMDLEATHPGSARHLVKEFFPGALHPANTTRSVERWIPFPCFMDHHAVCGDSFTLKLTVVYKLCRNNLKIISTQLAVTVLLELKQCLHSHT
jgi:hypothetical protein